MKFSDELVDDVLDEIFKKVVNKFMDVGFVVFYM